MALAPAALLGELEPELLGNERHERVQQLEHCREHIEQRALCSAPQSGVRGGVCQHCFRELEVPVTELVPCEVVERLDRDIKPVGSEAVVDRLDYAAQPRPNPRVGRRELDRAAGVEVAELAEDVRRSVPQLVAETVIALGARQVEAHVAARRNERGERQTQRVGPVGLDALGKLLARRSLDRLLQRRLHQPVGPLLEQGIEIDAVDEIDRIEDVALALRHLLPFAVADQGVDVDVAKRHVAGELQSHHDHARDPEEDDVPARHEHAGGIEGGELRGLVRPAQRRERPERRGKPGVEHVLVLREA